MNAARFEVWVLWAERFDEATAALFVTELRAAGLRTRLVSLGSRVVAGAHGLVLVADWTLEEALAHTQDAACIVIPAQLAGLQRLANDPRINTLFDRLATDRVPLIIGPAEAAPMAERVGLTLETLTPGPGLGEAARQWTERLLARRDSYTNGSGRRLAALATSADAAL